MEKGKQAAPQPQATNEDKKKEISVLEEDDEFEEFEDGIKFSLENCL
jgi:hypothetical protein